MVARVLATISAQYRVGPRGCGMNYLFSYWPSTVAKGVWLCQLTGGRAKLLVMTGIGLVALVAAVVFVGSTMQRIGGMGMGLIAGPILAMVIGPVDGILVVNLLAATNAMMAGYSMRAHIDWAMVRAMGPVMIVGAIAGSFLIKNISIPALQVLVGSLITVALLIVTFGKRYMPPVSGRLPVLLTGGIAGFSNTLAGVSGPVITVYGHAAKWGHVRLAATLQPLFVVAGLLSFSMKELTGAASMASIPWGVWPASICAMVVAISIGKGIARRVNPDAAKRFAIFLAFAGAVSVGFRGLMELI